MMTSLRRVQLAGAAAVSCIVVSLGSAGTAGASGLYHVANTGGSSLNVRPAPTLSAGHNYSLPAGATIDIACQTTGDEVNGVTNIWDQLTSGGYVSDYYTDTPAVGGISPGLSACSDSSLNPPVGFTAPPPTDLAPTN